MRRRGALGLPAKLAVGSTVLALLGCAAPAAMAAPAVQVAVGIPATTGPYQLGLIPAPDNAVAPASSTTTTPTTTTTTTTGTTTTPTTTTGTTTTPTTTTGTTTAAGTATSDIVLRTASLPASVDLTGDAMSPGNQGAIGSCAAWSSDYSALGYWENKENIPGGVLEPMYTYSQVDGGADNGSSIEANLSVDESGIDTQSDYYQGNFDYKDKPTPAEKAAAVNWKLSGYTQLAISETSGATVTQTSIETALAAGDPVVIGIPVYANFEYQGAANNGYYAGISGSFEGYHAIAALGYNAQGLVIENSWGTTWGDGGFATLSWAFVNGYVMDADQVGPLVSGQPIASAAPAITGTAATGDTLSASTGTWSPTPTGYAYQWETAPNGTIEWSEVAGATKSTFAPPAADQGQIVRVLVTATGTGTGASESAATSKLLGPVPVDSTLPGVTGTARVGQTLSAKTGAWTNTPTSYAYQWQVSTNNGVSWTSISGATGATYVTQTSDAGARDRVVVTAANANGAGTAVDSAGYGPISGSPFETTAPAISGTQIVGDVLTATTGAWNPAAASYAYQWQRSTNAGKTWVAIAGATSATYTLATADGNERVRVNVTATNGAGSASAASAESAAIIPGPPANTVKPALTGTAARGSTLTVGTGTWANGPTSYTYEWEQSANNGSSWTVISGATSRTLGLQLAQDNNLIEVLVTATNAAGSSTATSTVSAAVKPMAPAATAAPKVTGNVAVGAKLTATLGSWSGVGNSYAYAWQIETGGTWSSLSGATGATLVLTGSDVGDQVRVLVTATNNAGTASSPSVATASVPTPKA